MNPRGKLSGCLISALLAVMMNAAAAETAAEEELKAAYLYNLALFVQWPESSRRPTFAICQYGADALGAGGLALTRRELHGRPVTVRVVDGMPVKDCDLLYIPAEQKTDLRELTASLDGDYILTVSDATDAIRQGVAIGLLEEHRKIVFAVNLAAARAAELAISARLLNLAVEVTGGP